MTPGDRVEASSLRKPALSVLYQRKLIAWWILQSVVAQQDGWPLQPYPLLTLPAGSVVGTCAEGSLTTQQASFVDHVAVVLEHFLGLLEHLQEAYPRWVGGGPARRRRSVRVYLLPSRRTTRASSCRLFTLYLAASTRP